MIFLSASVPSQEPIPGRPYYGKGNVLAIREAIIAFTKVCMELEIPFCFGGHPAISPMVYNIARNYNEAFASHITIFQSEFYRGKQPEEVSYFNRIEWTPIVEKEKGCKPSLLEMRKTMLGQDYNCAVFIGGMDGVIDEARMFHELHPKAVLLAVPNTGGAAMHLEEELEFKIDKLPDSYAYVSLFKRFLEKYK